MRQLASHPARHRLIQVKGAPVALLDTPVADGVDQLGTALLVPGYTGSKEDFAPVLGPLAAEGFRVAAIDLPGQYESPGAAEPEAYAVKALAEVVLDVIEALGDGPVQLLGHSFGGLVARAAAIAEPAAMQSLTLLDSGPAGITGERRARIDALEPLLAAQGIDAVYEASERLARSEPGWLPPPPALRDFLRKRFVTSSAAGLQGMGSALRFEPDRVEELRRTGLPVLVAFGADDDAWNPDVQREMADRLDARCTEIPDAAHSPAVENPDGTVAVLSGFWRDACTAPNAGS